MPISSSDSPLVSRRNTPRHNIKGDSSLLADDRVLYILLGRRKPRLDPRIPSRSSTPCSAQTNAAAPSLAAMLRLIVLFALAAYLAEATDADTPMASSRDEHLRTWMLDLSAEQPLALTPNSDVSVLPVDGVEPRHRRTRIIALAVIVAAAVLALFIGLVAGLTTRSSSASVQATTPTSPLPSTPASLPSSSGFSGTPLSISPLGPSQLTAFSHSGATAPPSTSTPSTAGPFGILFTTSVEPSHTGVAPVGTLTSLPSDTSLLSTSISSGRLHEVPTTGTAPAETLQSPSATQGYSPTTVPTRRPPNCVPKGTASLRHHHHHDHHHRQDDCRRQ